MTSGCAFLHTKTVNTPFMWQIIITHYVSIVNGPNFDSFITQSLVVCRLASPTIRRVTCSTVRQLNLQFSIHCTLFVTHSSPKLRNCNIKSHKWCVRYYLLLLFTWYYYTYKYYIYTNIKCGTWYSCAACSTADFFCCQSATESHKYVYIWSCRSVYKQNSYVMISIYGRTKNTNKNRLNFSGCMSSGRIWCGNGEA